MSTPISIFIPVYNDARWLAGAIDSVLAQDHAAWEIVVGDNASTDDTESVVRAYDDPRIRYHSWETHVPIDENFNRTATLCRHDWVQLLCADDRLRPGCLSHDRRRPSRAAIPASRVSRWWSTACRRVDEHGRPADHVWYGTKRPLRRAAGHVFGCRVVLRSTCGTDNRRGTSGRSPSRRHVIEESGGFFRPEVGLSCDVELSLRACAYGEVDLYRCAAPRLHGPVPTRTARSASGRTGPGGMSRTPVEAALVAGLNVHRHRRSVSDAERRGVAAAIARSHLQRAAQHRVLPGGQGRAGTWRDVRLAWRWSRRTVLKPYQVAYALAALLAPKVVLENAKRRLSARSP